MLKKPADFERAINDLEFENQQYVKQIGVENQKIEALEKAAEGLRSDIKVGNDSIHQLEDDIKTYHRQFTHNRFSVESYRSTLEMLTKHEDALVSKKELSMKRSSMEREERQGFLEHYRAILKDYKEKYAGLKHTKVLEEKKAAAEDLQKKLQTSLEVKLQLKEQCEKQTGKDDLPFRCINSYMLKVAELYMQSQRDQCVLTDLVKNCSSLELAKSQEMEEIEQLQKAVQEQKRKMEEKKRQKELQEQKEKAEQKKREEEERQRHMEAEKKRETAIKRKEEMIVIPQQARTSQQAPEASARSSQQQAFMLQMPHRPQPSTLPTLQPPHFHIPQAKKSRIQESVPTLRSIPPSVVSKSSPSRIPLLQSPMLPAAPLIRQVQEKQMQKKMTTKQQMQVPSLILPQKQQYQKSQSHHQVAPPSPIVRVPAMLQMPASAAAATPPSLSAPSSFTTASSTHLSQSQGVAASAAASAAASSSASPPQSASHRAPCSSPANHSQAESPGQLHSTSGAATVVSTTTSPIVCPTLVPTPCRPVPTDTLQQPKTPKGAMESPTSDGSPFDLDKQLAKMHMLAAKSPGAFDWSTRPMFDTEDNGDEISNKPVSPTQASSMFDSTAAFLSTPFSLFGDNTSAEGGGGGDTGSSKHMFASPQTGGGAGDGGEDNGEFDVSMPQGESSAFCLNFGGADSGGGGDGSSRNYMAMFASAGDDDDEEGNSTEGDSFTFNFGSTMSSSDSAPSRFSLF